MIVDRFLEWAVKRSQKKIGGARPIVTFEGDPLFDRYEFWRPDEWPDSWWDDHRGHYPKRPNALPWWQPLNAFVHKWHLGVPESFHDHPRWSVSICLKGRIIEMNPWGERELRPGSIVIRSRKAIHAFRRPEGYDGEVWTLFIVGRRKHRQNSYEITKR